MPSTIGRLRIERQLGAGGFGTVWLAHDPELDSPVAVKVLAENFAAHADVRRRFTDEARLLRRVDSDHLVRVYDVGELPDGRPFFVMTYADRGTLAHRLVHRPPPWPVGWVLAVVDAVAAGLAVLHRHGVVHRDIKPANVLFRATPDGGERILLGDLGIAKDLQWASSLTMPSGSSGYAAPEQESYSERIGPPTDVHALAVTAGQLLGLQPPWPPTPVGAVLARASAPDPAGRTSSAAEFAAQLREALHQGPPPAPCSPAAPPPPPGQQTQVVPPPAPTPLRSPTRSSGPGRRWTIPVSAGLTLALAVGVGWAVTQRERRVVSADGRVSVAVPAGWTRQDGVPYPGNDDPGSGVRVSEGSRSVTVALGLVYTDPRVLLSQVRPAGCTSTRTSNVRVDTWSGVSQRYAGCPDGAEVHEVVLADEAGRAWTVWVEVRSVSGVPDVTDVLGSLEITPDG